MTKARARRKTQTKASALQKWWSDHFNVAPDDPSVVDKSEAELEEAWYEWLFGTLEELKAENEENPSRALQEKIDRVQAVIDGEKYEEDPLIAQWERELAEGKIPDLEQRSA
jgi:hypothetical protein